MKVDIILFSYVFYRVVVEHISAHPEKENLLNSTDAVFNAVNVFR